MARVSMNDTQNVRYRIEALGCSKDELANAVARVGNSPDAVRRELSRHWGYGTFRQDDAPKPRRRGRPALGERSHRSLALSKRIRALAASREDP